MFPFFAKAHFASTVVQAVRQMCNHVGPGVLTPNLYCVSLTTTTKCLRGWNKLRSCSRNQGWDRLEELSNTQDSPALEKGPQEAVILLNLHDGKDGSPSRSAFATSMP